MVNPLELMKAYFAVNNAVADVKKGPKPGWYSSEFWLVAFTSSVIVLEGVKGLIPPTYALYASLGLAIAYQVMRFVLKLKHIELPTVPGLQTIDLAAELEKFKVKNPDLCAAAKDALETKPVPPAPSVS